MNSIITRALMRYHNDFFKMTEEEQDVFKLQDHEELDDKVEAFVREELNIPEADRNNRETLEYNSIVLHYSGIGPNYFMLNEFGWREEVLKYKNFYEYNEGNHNYQEEAFFEDENFEGYKKEDLYSRLSEWARVEIDNEFFYLNIFNYQIWVYYALEEAEHDWIDDNIPYDLVSGPDDGKKTDGGTLWDMRRDAKGKEGWLEQMFEFARKWTTDFYDDIKHKDMVDMVFINDTSGKDFEGDPNKDYIFGSIEVLKEISFKTFVEDCDRMQGDSELAYQFRDNAIKDFRKALDEHFIEVQKTPPNVLKIPTKKKMKVAFADGALDDLARIARDDDDDGD